MANTYKNVKADLTSTGLVVLLNVPTGSTCIIKSILVSEDTGATPTIDITLVESSNIFSLFKSEGLAANQTKELLTQPLVIQEGQELKAQASAGNQLHIVVSYLEIT